MAFGGSRQETTNAGAFGELASQPLGGTLLAVLVGGLALLVLWQVVEAGFVHRDEDGAQRIGKRVLSLGKAGCTPRWRSLR